MSGSYRMLLLIVLLVFMMGCVIVFRVVRVFVDDFGFELGLGFIAWDLLIVLFDSSLFVVLCVCLCGCVTYCFPFTL